PVIDQTLRYFRARAVEAVERPGRNVGKELCAIVRELRPKSVEHLDRKSTGIGFRLEHDRRHCADQNRLRDPAELRSSDIARNLTAARRVADMDRVLEI